MCFVFLLQYCVGVKSYLGLGSSHFLETGLRILQVTFLTGSDLWEEEENKNGSSTFLWKISFAFSSIVKILKALYVNMFESLNILFSQTKWQITSISRIPIKSYANIFFLEEFDANEANGIMITHLFLTSAHDTCIWDK